MNERIKELAEQAGYTKDMFGVGHWDMPECKKFAELIVRECLEIVEDEDDGSQDTIAVRWAMHRIRKHFGVK